MPDSKPEDQNQNIIVSARTGMGSGSAEAHSTASQQQGRVETIDQTTSFQHTIQSTEQNTSVQEDRIKTLVGTLELREEVPEVNISREHLGQVRVRRERRVREETVTIDLVTEVLVIETVSGNPHVRMFDVDLPVGETMEIEIYREDAEIGKKVVKSEEVRIFKEKQVDHLSVPIELAREELVVEKNAIEPNTAPDTRDL